MIELATAKEVCAKLKISPATLWRWVNDGKFPRPRKIGPHCTRWLHSEIKEWLEKYESMETKEVSALRKNETTRPIY